MDENKNENELPEPKVGAYMYVECEGGLKLQGTLLAIEPLAYVALRGVPGYPAGYIAYVPWDKVTALVFEK